MRRWLTLLLLFALPLQFAWSAAAAYCQHEQVPAKTHVGHHAHEHEAGGDTGATAHADEASSAKGGKVVGDNDCGYCHLSFSKPMVPVALQFDTDAAFPLDAAPPLAFRSRGPDLLERPNWRLA